jgi:tetratricopeptide (TPR) repeat protein
LGADHLLVAHPLNGLANLYQRQGKYEQARLLYERVLDMRQRLLAPQHPDTVETRKWYAALLRAMDRSDEATLLEIPVSEPTKSKEGQETH